jgi:hypothetical protein
VVLSLAPRADHDRAVGELVAFGADVGDVIQRRENSNPSALATRRD